MDWLRVWRRKAFFLKNSRYSRLGRLNAARLLSAIALFLFIFVIVASVSFFALFIYFAKDLPRPDKIVRREGFATKIYDRQGELIYDVYIKERRTPVNLTEIPVYLQQATIAIEDKNFKRHSGFDPAGWIRAVYNIIFRHRLQGGSTLTQQLVKNVLLTSQRTIPRKIKEFILAVQIESRYSKDEILQMYLNETSYGGTAVGVESAAEQYFGKRASELNLVESAILAGLPQRPSFYSPFGDQPKAYIDRTKQVLRRMREDNYITSEQEEEAIRQLDFVQFASKSAEFKAPHFVMYVKKLLEERYGQQMTEQGGLRVYTTLDLSFQEKVQKIVSEEIAKVEQFHITNGASLVMDPQTGEILAMVGSKNYDDPNYDGKFNVVTALRQPGSAIKPVTYAAALRKGYTLSTMIMDTPTVFPVGGGQPDYKPVNYDEKWHGPMQVRFALGNSINLTAVKMLAMVGLKDMLSLAYDMGLSTLEPTKENLSRLGLAVTLGGGEIKLIDLVSAYSSFANGGKKVEPIAILKVTDKDGKIIDEYRSVEGKQVLQPEEAFLISHVLADNQARKMTFGEHSNLVIPSRMVAVKTGTTNDKRDNWTIGWNPQVIVGVWVGNNDNSQMKKLASGISGAAPIWNKIITTYLEGKPNVDFSPPEGIVTAEVDNVSGYRAHDGFPSRMEYFIKGTEPLGNDPVHQKLKVCPGQEKLASLAQVARGQYEEKEYFIFKEEDPVSSDGQNRWQQGIDEWLKTQTDSRYHPPSEFCGNISEVEVNIQEPGNEVQLSGSEVKVAGKIISINDIARIEIRINGQLKETLEQTKHFEKIFNLPTGTYVVNVRAFDNQGNMGEREAKFGLNVSWDWQPTPEPTHTPVPTPTPQLSPGGSPVASSSPTP